ncbi:heme NO-binding domain-containing protein [Polyangium sp. y55x31]|uniref:heme NO-binding domain-containing protein n=1 Tax=Polyangium sp. y55x31 TaxID=3042688 RepID=UPI00248289FE|nr:heme NO-binding domain-containing protein [Polyangium sp. y55x31]MDI1477626.1 heme NO-binding domain-containing protein [Polyangium sp. y55x31]
MVLGVILLGFQNYVRERLGEELWRTIRNEAGVAERVYLPSQTYPGEELHALATSMSRLTGMSPALVLESFGDKLAAELLKVYGNLVDPRWRVLDVLVHSEELIERMAQRSGDLAPHSPVSARWGRDGEVVLVYQSHLKGCALIKGIVRGLGANLEQPVLLDENRCMLAGASTCEMAVRLERTTQLTERAQGLARRLTPPAMSRSALKSALFGDRSDMSSVPPPPASSSKQETLSAWRTETKTNPPASGVTPARISTLPSAPSTPSTPSTPPPSPDADASELWRRR